MEPMRGSFASLHYMTRSSLKMGFTRRTESYMGTSGVHAPSLGTRSLFARLIPCSEKSPAWPLRVPSDLDQRDQVTFYELYHRNPRFQVCGGSPDVRQLMMWLLGGVS